MQTKQKSSRLTVKGQITLPKAYRDAMKWTTRTRLTFVRESDGIKVVALNSGLDVGEALVRRGSGIATSGLTTDEIMAMTRGED